MYQEIFYQGSIPESLYAEDNDQSVQEKDAITRARTLDA